MEHVANLLHALPGHLQICIMRTHLLADKINLKKDPHDKHKK